MVIKLYDMDTLEYSGQIIAASNTSWEYENVNNDFMIQMTKGMPLKAVLANLVVFNLVYDVHQN